MNGIALSYAEQASPRGLHYAIDPGRIERELGWPQGDSFESEWMDRFAEAGHALERASGTV